MKIHIPLAFYPAPLPLTAGQKRRIRSLVQRGLSAQSVYYTLPRRSPVPVLICMVLCLCLGFAAAQPEIRDIAAQAAARIHAFFDKEETETTETLPPETETETDAQTDPETVLPAVAIGAQTTNGDVRLTVDKVIRSADGFYFHLNLEHLTDTFAGYLLQFDTLDLSVNTDPDNTYKNTDRWKNLLFFNWGVPGIYAGEVFTLLDQETPQSAVSHWLFCEASRMETGQYRLQIGRLFGCDTAGPEFVCTEYGDFEIVFTVDALPEPIQDARLIPETRFRIGEQEYTLSAIEIGPLSVNVEITCSRDSTFSPEGYPDLPLTPVYNLYGMFDIVSELELTGEKRNALYEQQYKLVPYYSTDIAPHTITQSCHSSSFYKQEETEDTVFFTFALQDPLTPDMLQKLVLERMDGGDSIVIWENP